MNHVLLRIAEHNHASAAVAHSTGFELTDADPITRVGSDGAELVPASPGPPPVTRPPTSRRVEPGLLLAVDRGEYTLRVRWYTELGDDGCLARWLFLPGRTAR